MNREYGFTLVELLISITLGLILVAVAVQLFISGQVNYRIQQAASTIQDSGVFSLNAIVKNIRLANHGNGGLINDETHYGGVVLSAQKPHESTNADTKKGNLHNLKIGSSEITSANALSQNEAHTSGFGTLKSDQLVIVYQAPVDMMTCTGTQAKGPIQTLDTVTGTLSMQKGWYVIERYYLKQNTTTGSADLYCSDAMFLASGETVVSPFLAPEVLTKDFVTNDGEMVATNVDYMRVQLIVKQKNSDPTKEDMIATIGLNEYENLTNSSTTPRASVIGINLGWLVRSSETIPNIESKTYQVLDRSISSPADKFMRHVFTTSIALRNGGFGESH